MKEGNGIKHQLTTVFGTGNTSFPIMKVEYNSRHGCSIIDFYDLLPCRFLLPSLFLWSRPQPPLTKSCLDKEEDLEDNEEEGISRLVLLISVDVKRIPTLVFAVSKRKKP